MGLLDQQQPGAITQMLGLLANNPPAGQPGQPAPAPAAPMNVPMQQPAPHQNLLGKIHDYIQDRLGGNVPAEYQSSGLLSPEEIQSAKPGILQEIAHSDSYRKNLDRILAMHQEVASVNERQRVMEARRAMPALFPQADNESADQTRQRLAKMYAYAMANGDEETMKDVGSRLSSIFAAPRTDTTLERAPHPVMVDGKPQEVYVDKTGKNYDSGGNLITGKITPYVAPREPGAQYVWATNPSGQTVYTTKETAAQPGWTKPSADSAQNQLMSGRGQAAISEMNNSDKGLRQFEAGLKNGTENFTGLDQFISAVGDSFENDDFKSKAAQAAALATLNKSNPSLARYIRRGLSFAEGESLISQRASDYRTKLAAFLSTASTGAPNEMIDDIQSRRGSILTPLNASKLGQQAAAANAAAKGKPKLTQAGYAKGRAQGLTDAQLATHYDISGVMRK